ncbi:MAG TPA: methyltransferase domain-containing protein [Agriterribacter sp.]|nr:methyltransferase domain-containing protein [Agriterribacter sp.]
MEFQLEQIRQQQKEAWNKFSPGWGKWDKLTMEFLRPMGDEIIRLLCPEGDDLVLDVASGTGEPGLTIASRLDGGKVIAIDISEGMLEVARGNATKQGIKNFETQVGDVCELPFNNNTFDLISCRFGFMFFPDMQLAAHEMERVLKPGGRIATSVWNIPEKNFWVTAIMSIIKKNLDLPAPPPEAPGMFRCAKPGFMESLLTQAGLRNVSALEVNGKLQAGTADVYWDMMTEVGAPIVAALNTADDPMKVKIKDEVFDLLHQKFPDGNIIIDSSALVIYGEK